MIELKYWMKEIELQRDDYVPPSLYYAVRDADGKDEINRIQKGTGPSRLSPMSFTVVPEQFSNACLSSQSGNHQLRDFEEPDIVMLDDDPAVPTIEAYNFEHAQFVDQCS
jgi:hypothetical protein